MTTKTQLKSRILEAVHETMSDLQRLGFVATRFVSDNGAPLDKVPDQLEADYTATAKDAFSP
jgi:hypothetical protein